jgi:hypothetical protein
MKNILSKRLDATGWWLAVLVIAIPLQRVSLWAIAFGIYITYKTFNPYLSSRIFTSKFYRLAAVFLIYTLVIQCVIVSLWVVYANTSLQLTPLITAVLMTGLFLVLQRFAPAEDKRVAKEHASQPFLHRYDLIAIALTLALVSVLILPSMFKNGYQRSNIVKFVNTGVDDSSHMSLLNDHIDRDRGVLTGVENPEQLRNTTMYPAGWHSLNAVLIHATVPTITTGNATLIAYILTKIAWFAVLLYWAFRLGLQLIASQAKKGKLLTVVESLAFVAVSAYFVQVYMHVFMEGFYSFIPQILYGIMLLSLICQLKPRAKSGAPDDHLITTLPLLLIVAVGGGLSWFLPTPGFALFLGLLVVSYTWGKGWLANVKTFARRSVPFLPIYILAIAAILIQSYVLTHDTSAGAVSFSQSLLLRGGITIYDINFYLVFGIGLAAFFVMLRRSQKQQGNLAFGALLLFASVLSYIAMIYLYQQLKIGANAYYYHKLVYLVLAIATPLVIVGYVYLLRLAAENNMRILLYTTLLICGLVMFIGIEPTMTKHPVNTYTAYFVGRRKVPTLYNEVIYENLRAVSTQKAVNDKNYYFFYAHGQIQMDTPSMLLKSNKPFSSCYESIRGTFLQGQGILSTERAARRDCKRYNVYLIANDEDREAVSRLHLKKLKLMTYGQSKGYVPFK